jgi:DNA topoisomerase-1
MHLADGGKYYNTGIDPTNNFELDLKISEDKFKTVQALKEAAKNADLVYLMSDGDREGEVISWSLIKFLKLPKTKYRRAITHEITPKAVVHAIENPIQLNEDMADAGLARLTLDKLLGYRLSPIAKTYVGAKSVGRCQSVGLKLVADREKEIQNFIPETYFDIYLNFVKNSIKFKAKYAGNNIVGNIDHLKTQAEVDAVLKNCTKDFVIEDIKQKIKEESPKPPFCTATMQQEASSKIGLKVKDVMAIAQKLFEGGFITYHRTDDQTLAPEFIPELKSYIESNYGKSAYTTPRVGKKGDNAQEGHEAIRVTDLTVTPDVFNKLETNALNEKLYKLIWQRTVACALPNAQISETSYLIDNNGEKFILVSKEITSLGYREVYAYKDDDDKDENRPVKETFKKGEKLKNCALENVMKQTKAPPRYSEATLIKKLETSGVGRPSTYATIVETVLSTTRGYAELKDKTIVPTDRGLQLAAFLDRNFNDIINTDYTKKMEEGLDQIASGKKTKLEFLNECYHNLEDTIKNNKEIQSIPASEDKICPECGAPMVLRRSKFGKLFYGCSRYPKCHGIINIK